MPANHSNRRALAAQLLEEFQLRITDLHPYLSSIEYSDLYRAVVAAREGVAANRRVCVAPEPQQLTLEGVADGKAS